MTSQNVDLINKAEEERQFYAYINRNGALVNEGIVASERFVQRLEELEEPKPVCKVQQGSRRYLVCDVESAGEALRFAIRRLGRASFKGIGKLVIYEIVDPEPWRLEIPTPMPRQSLSAALDALTATRQRTS